MNQIFVITAKVKKTVVHGWTDTLTTLAPSWDDAEFMPAFKTAEEAKAYLVDQELDDWHYDITPLIIVDFW